MKSPRGSVPPFGGRGSGPPSSPDLSLPFVSGSTYSSLKQVSNRTSKYMNKRVSKVVIRVRDKILVPDEAVGALLCVSTLFYVSQECRGST